MDKVDYKKYNANASQDLLIISLVNKLTYSIYVEDSELSETNFNPLVNYGFEFEEVAELIDLRFNTIVSLLLQELLEYQTKENTIKKLVGQGCSIKEATSIVNVAKEYILTLQNPSHIIALMFVPLLCFVLAFVFEDLSSGAIIGFIVSLIYVFKPLVDYIKRCKQYYKLKAIIRRV